MKKSIILLALAIAVLLPRGDAFALTLSPPRWQVAADVGATVQGDILLINDEQEAKTFYSSFENFEAQGDSGNPRFTGGNEGLATWISTEQSVTLQPGESKKIPFTIRIPANTEEAGYFAVIFWGTNPPNAEQGQEVSVGAKVGTLLFVTVGTNIPESAGLLNFNIKDKKFFHKSLPVVFDYRFTNSGGDRVQPKGTITIRSVLGWRAARIDANPFQGNILPNTTRKFSPEWTKLSPDERPNPSEKAPYSFSGALKTQWRNFALGVFRAKMHLEYGHTNQGVTSKAAYFIVFPLELMLIIIASVAILFFMLRLLVRRYNRWVISKAQARLIELQQKSNQ